MPDTDTILKIGNVPDWSSISKANISDTGNIAVTTNIHPTRYSPDTGNSIYKWRFEATRFDAFIQNKFILPWQRNQ